jgi:hypothetical protein
MDNHPGHWLMHQLSLYQTKYNNQSPQIQVDTTTGKLWVNKAHISLPLIQSKYWTELDHMCHDSVTPAEMLVLFL